MAAVLGIGAASALGLGKQAYDVGGVDGSPKNAWSTRPPGKPFGRVLACQAGRAERPKQLLELGLTQLVAELDASTPDWRSQRLGVVIGTSSGGLAALERALPMGAASEHWSQSAYFAPLRQLAGQLGREPDRFVALYGACASSALALGLGLRWLELGWLDLVIAGGYDAESDWVCAGFDSLKATSAGEPRPFRLERDGMALGEGVALVALARRADAPRGFVRGFGASSDALHITAPDRTGRGLARAAQQALGDAGLAEQSIDFVSVHGTGTSFNDASEAAALKLVFGERAESLPLHAFKASVGHTLGAAGALEALAALSALEHGVLPASASLGAAMPELAAPLLERNQAAPVEQCLKLATAFGGSNAALVLSRTAAGPRRRVARPVHLVATGVPCCELDVARIASLLLARPERLPRSDALSELAVSAAAEALRDLGARGVVLDRLRTGVVVGSVGATLEADAAFAERILTRGTEHAEPRRFPATSPNAAAGHVAIAFGLGGLSHAVGSGAAAALEAAEVAHDWIAAGDVDAVLVVAVEQVGETSRRALAALDIVDLEQGAYAVVLAAIPAGPVVDAGLFRVAQASGINPGFRGLEALSRAAGLPGSSAFGSVRPPE